MGKCSHHLSIVAVAALVAFGAGHARAQAIEDTIKRAGDDIVEDGKAVICFLNPNASVCKQPERPPASSGANRPRPVVERSGGANAADSQREETRRLQSALNGLGFDAGVADGIMGRRTNGAVSAYQAHMGYPVTGTLDAAQRQQLVAAEEQIASGAAARRFPRTAEAEGALGLVRALADPSYEDRFAPEQEPTVADNREPETGGEIGDAEPDVIAGRGDDDAIPDGDLGQDDRTGGQVIANDDLEVPMDVPVFEGNQALSVSMAEHCELVAGMTQINLGPLLTGTPANADQALGEQFCDARSYSITQSNGLLDQSGGTAEQYVTFCSGIAERLRPAIALVPTGDTKQVAVSAQQVIEPIFADQMSRVSTVGRICLGIGYRLDDAEIALGATTMLLASAELPFGELLGHHARWGFGTTRDQTVSRTWYMTALAAMERGAAPVFSPSKSLQRNAIIRGALAVDGAQLGSLTVPTLD